jgi:hypothetical protein
MATHIDKILNEKSPAKVLAYLRRQNIESLAVTQPRDPLSSLTDSANSLGVLFIL